MTAKPMSDAEIVRREADRYRDRADECREENEAPVILQDLLYRAVRLERIADDLERRARETKRMVADYEAGKIEARRTP